MIALGIWYWLLVPLGLALAAAVVWIYRFSHEIHAERARESFRLQHERLEQVFFEKAATGGQPRGLVWKSCSFSDQVKFARERHSKLVVALVAVTVEFDAIGGSDMEGLPAVAIPRQGTALLHFERGHWTASGRVIFNLDPVQALAQLGHEFREVHPHGHHQHG